MDSYEALRELKNRLPEYLAEKGVNTSGLFTCLNPNHPDHNPSMSLDMTQESPHAHCFSCGSNYSIIDLIQMDYHVDTPQAIQIGFQKYGIRPDYQYKPTSPYRKNKTAKPAKNDRQKQYTDESITPPDFTAEIEQAHRTLLNAKNEKPYQGEPLNSPEIFYSYLRDKRGVTDEQIKEYRIGFVYNGLNDVLFPHLDHPVFQSYTDRTGKKPYYGKTANISHKLILPNLDPDGKSHYFYSEISDREILKDPKNGKYAGGKYIKPKGIRQPLFNDRYLKSKKPPELIFICEGYYDALAYERTGVHAIGLIGVGYKEFERLLREYKPETRFVLALDSDQTGQERTTRIVNLLDELGYGHDSYVLDFSKDADEAWQNDRSRFEMEVQKIKNNAPIPSNPEIYEAHKRELEREYAKDLSPYYHLDSFIDDIIQSQNDEAIPTGIQSLDDMLDGGLYSGLYAIGALSSLGKTTFCTQIMDWIASNGNDVLFFSLEMSRKELMAKSISRLTFLCSHQNYGSGMYARSTREILTGSKYKGLSKNHIENISTAVESYKKISGNIYIIEADDDFTYNDIDKAIRKHIEKTGRKPVVFIDYLQILDPPEDLQRTTQKENMDKAVKVLKHISRDYTIPVIAISSFNRSNYDKPVKGMDSFKESGGIEYSCDFCFILDYIETKKGAEQDFLIRTRSELAKQGKSFPIVCRIEKNRNGSKGRVYLDFFPKYNFYQPSLEVK